MKTWLTKLALTALTAALLLPSATTFASSNTLYVDDDKKQCSSAQFTSVQAAVDAAKGGDTVYVCPGTYHERVTISKRLTLRGKAINGQALPLITVTGNGGFVDAVVHVQNASDVRIRDLHIVGDDKIFGVLAEHSTHLTVERLEMEGAGIAILLEEHSDKSVVQNTGVHGSLIGIALSDSSQVTVAQNTLQISAQGLLGESGGILFARADTSTASGNTITNGERGIFVADSSSVQVTNNTVTTPHEVGIRLEGVAKSTVRNNTVTDSKNNGIGLTNGTEANKDNTIEDNTIKQSVNQDAHDTSVGNKTAGTANTWKNNTCVTSDPAGLCKKK